MAEAKRERVHTLDPIRYQAPGSSRVDSSLENNALRKYATDLVHAQFTKEVVTVGRHYIPPFPRDDRFAKLRVSDVPSMGKGVQAELAQAAMDEAIEQAMDIIKHIWGGNGSSAPPPRPHLNNFVQTTAIGFDDAPVGGWSSLSIWPNGAFNFSGHMHDSGAPSYDYGVVWVFSSLSGTAFVFANKGRLHGTFEAGSRDDDWNQSGTNSVIADAWDDISAGYHWQCSAEVNMDLGQLIDSMVKATGDVMKVVAVVG
jgi:hypothetical protein